MNKRGAAIWWHLVIIELPSHQSSPNNDVWHSMQERTNLGLITSSSDTDPNSNGDTGLVDGNHASVREFDLHTGGVDIERTRNHFLVHDRFLLNLFLFSWTSGL